MKSLILTFSFISLFACKQQQSENSTNQESKQRTTMQNVHINPKYNDITATNFKEKILESVKHYPNEPMYYMRIGKANCVIEVLVNDYRVYRNYELSNQVTPEEINFGVLKSGLQTISSKLLPNLGERQLNSKAELKFDIKLFDVSNDFVFDKQFGEYQSEPIDNKKPPIVSYTNTFQAIVPYKLDAWQKSKNLRDIEFCKMKLDAAYKKITKIIENGNFEEYKQLISKRENNMVTSMYLSKKEAEGRMIGLINDFNSGFKVQPILDDCVMMFYANDRVAALKKTNGEPALYLFNEETQEELMLDLSFHIPEGKTEFEVI